MIKCVIFDIDNTLYSYTKANEAAMEALYAYVKKNLGINRERYDRLTLEVRNQIEARLNNAAIHNRFIRFQNILETAEDLPASQKNCYAAYPHAMNMYHCYWDTFLGNMECAPYCRELLGELRKRNIRIGIGTDMTALIQYRKLETLKILPLIDFMVTSEEAGAEKPDPEFFRLCIHKAGCRPHECLFIGDHPEKDVKGAWKAGMNVLRYDSAQAVPLKKTEGVSLETSEGILFETSEGIFPENRISDYKELLYRLDDYLADR
ncbi:MAG: HAD family hydrolase [Lachnospiraceae bacterium]|nr:HAD family hydrolase [Lachnospiraceae bacterium]